MTHAGQCSLCPSRQDKHSLGLPFMTVKIISIDNLKINKICGFFKRNPEFVFLTARVLRPSFERRRNQRCLIPLVKAIRVRVRNSPKSHRARPGSSFSASVARVCYGDADQTALRSTSYPAAFIASATAYIQLFPESYCTYKIPLRSEGSSTPDSYTTQTRSRPSRLKKNPISKITFCLARSYLGSPMITEPLGALINFGS